MNPLKSDLSVIVQTCDRYSDVWNGFYMLFNKYWGNCPYPVFHVSETKCSGQEKIQTILTGELEWSGRLIAALDKVDSDFVLLLLEDYYLIKNVDERQIEHCISILKANPNAAYLRVFPVPGPDADYPGFTDTGIILNSSAYSVSTQATIWRREALKSMLLGHETVWDFELKGSERIAHFTYDLLCLKINHSGKKAEHGDYPYTYLCTAVYKGKWMKEAIQLCEKEKIILDLKYRRAETSIENFYRRKYHTMPNLIKHGLDFMRTKLVDRS